MSSFRYLYYGCSGVNKNKKLFRQRENHTKSEKRLFKQIDVLTKYVYISTIFAIIFSFTLFKYGFETLVLFSTPWPDLKKNGLLLLEALKSLTLSENQLLKQRRKKPGPQCGVDFKQELTLSGFPCISFFKKELSFCSFELGNQKTFIFSFFSDPHHQYLYRNTSQYLGYLNNETVFVNPRSQGS